MHAVAAFFASIITFVSGFFAPPLASNFPPNIRASQPAAVAQAEIIGDPFNDPDAASAVTAAIPAAALAPVFSPPPAPTVINQPVIERIIERIVPQGGTISAEMLAAILADFEQSISNRLAALNPPPAAIPAQVAAGGNSGSYTFSPASQRIDQLTNTAINTPTITGGTISGASVSGYLPLSGGALSGALSAGTLALSGTFTGTDASFSGTLTAGTLNVAGLSSQGALIGPYFTATSTTATSTFAGGLTAANGGFSILQNGNVGIGTTNPNFISANANSHVLSISGDSGSNFFRGVLELRNPDEGMVNNGDVFFVGGSNQATMSYARISSGSEGAGGVSGYGSNLTFTTKTDNSAAAERMRIDSSGRVGIGTTTPGALLSANGNILGAGTLALTCTTGTTTIASGQGFTIGSSQFLVQQGSGNVGIGTTTPLSKLDVYGTPGSDTSGLTISGSANSTGRLAIYANGTGSTAFKKLVSNGYISFLNSSGSSELIIDDTGNVSVGAVDGAADFFVSGSAVIGSGYSLNSGATDGLIVQGNVGIGTTTPWGKLSITGSGTGTSLAFAVADSANTPRFVIQDNGNVGIGNTSPSAKLAIQQSGGGAGDLLHFRDSTDSNDLVLRYNGDDWEFRSELSGVGTPFLSIDSSTGNIGIGTTSPAGKLAVHGTYSSLNGTLGAGILNIVSTNAAAVGTGGTLQFGGETGNATTPYVFAAIRGSKDDSVAAYYGGALHFHTVSSGENGETNSLMYERMRIDRKGNVGIGTTSPGTLLHIGSSGTNVFTDALNPGIRISSNSIQGIAFDDAQTSGNYRNFAIMNRHQAAGLLTIQRSTTAGGLPTSVMATFEGTTGNVGIGTTTPWGKLSITGSGTGTSLAFAVADSANTPRFVIQDNGNIGIGTTSPTNTLSVLGTGYVSGNLGVKVSGTTFVDLALGDNDTGFDWVSDGNFALYTNNVERMRFTGTGNIGIGTTTPGTKLDVFAGGNGVADAISSTARFVNTTNAGTNARVGIIAGASGASILDFGDTDNVQGGVGYVHSSDYMYLLTQGAERLRITSSGNVGIGTTTPWGKLSITGSGTGTGLAFAVADSANTPRFVIQDNGNVGIGTVNPGAVLDAITNVRASLSGTPTWYTQISAEGGGAFLKTAGYSTLNLTVGATNVLQLSGSTNSLVGNLSLSTSKLSGVSGTAYINLYDVSTGQIHIANTSSSGTFGNILFETGSSATERMRISNAGNVGIGTTSPWGKLSITGSGTGTGFAFAVADSANTPRFVIQDNGNVGIGTTNPGQTTPAAKLEVIGNIGLSGLITNIYNQSQIDFSANTIGLRAANSGNAQLMILNSGNVGIGETAPGSKLSVSGGGSFGSGYDTTAAPTGGLIIEGNVGIGTTTPSAQLTTTGTVRFSNFGAGTLTTDASGNLSVSSDERLKNIDGEFTRGLADVLKLSPISYHWNATSGLDTNTKYAGFSAQNVQQAVPEAVGSSANGYLTLQDRPLIATVVNAIKELAHQVSDFAERVVTKELVAVNGSFRNIRAEELCFGDSPTDESPVCLTKSQVAAVLAAASQSAVSPSPASVGAPQAPVIELNGNATSTIEVGDTYNDLGARITAPESDLNLGIVILLDGATTTTTSIDTSAPGDHTILYTVTSPTTGLTGSVMRTVTVQPAADFGMTSPPQDESLPPSDVQPINDNPAPAEDANPFNALPSNDNASSTAAVDVAA